MCCFVSVVVLATGTLPFAALLLEIFFFLAVVVPFSAFSGGGCRGSRVYGFTIIVV